MLDQPFAIFQPFPAIRTAFFMKEDPKRSDEELALLLGGNGAAALHQMHDNRVIRVRGPVARTEQADGLITDVPGLVLLIRAADCQNFVIAAPAQRVLGVLHVGWRGLEAGAIGEFFQFLKTEFGIGAEKTFVGGGPSLCKKCAEFSDPLRELPKMHRECINGNRVDLQREADLQFREAGVLDERRERMEGCTRCSPNRFWTYRGGDREAVKTGSTNVLAAMML